MKKIVLGLILVLIAMIPVTALDLNRGLVAYYSFDNIEGNILKDDSGNGHDGMIYGNPKIVNGIKGKALEFDGIDDYIEVPNDNDLNPPIITLSMWINCHGVPPCKYASHNHHIIINKETQYEVAIMGEPCGEDVKYAKEIGFAFNPYWHWYGADYVIDFAKWYHIVVVYENPYAYVYVNGVMVKRQKIGDGGYIKPVNSLLRIGARGGISENNYKPMAFFKGIIDEIRIYNRALSDEEIKALYEQTLHPTPKPKLKLTIDCDTMLKQGEVRNAELTIENVGSADAKDVKVTVTSPSLGVNVEKGYDVIPSKEARTITFQIAPNEAGKFKITAVAEYWDEEGNKYIETTEKVIEVKPVPIVTATIVPTTTIPTPTPTKRKPVAKFVYYPTNPVAGDEITFDASPSYDIDGTIVRYEWKFSDGSIAEGKVVKHIFPAGSFTVTLTVIDNDGLKSTVTQQIYVKQSKKPKLVITYLGVNPEEVYKGETVEIRADVVNVGETEGTFKINLMIDGKIRDYQEVFLKPNEHKTISFVITAKELGTHIVRLGYKEEVFPSEVRFYVKEKPSSPPTTPHTTIPGFELYLAILAISSIALARKLK